jgi:hypothetical protein
MINGVEEFLDLFLGFFKNMLLFIVFGQMDEHSESTPNGPFYVITKTIHVQFDALMG